MWRAESPLTRPLNLGGLPLLVLLFAVLAYRHDWARVVPVAILSLGLLASLRLVDRVEIHDDTVTLTSRVRTVRLQPNDIHRLRRTRLMRNVVVETAAGKFRLPVWLKGLHDLAARLQTLNPALVIDGP